MFPAYFPFPGSCPQLPTDAAQYKFYPDKRFTLPNDRPNPRAQSMSSRVAMSCSGTLQVMLYGQPYPSLFPIKSAALAIAGIWVEAHLCAWWLPCRFSMCSLMCQYLPIRSTSTVKIQVFWFIILIVLEKWNRVSSFWINCLGKLQQLLQKLSLRVSHSQSVHSACLEFFLQTTIVQCWKMNQARKLVNLNSFLVMGIWVDQFQVEWNHTWTQAPRVILQKSINTLLRVAGAFWSPAARAMAG